MYEVEEYSLFDIEGIEEYYRRVIFVPRLEID
jgi:hypothetical protein